MAGKDRRVGEPAREGGRPNKERAARRQRASRAARACLQGGEPRAPRPRRARSVDGASRVLFLLVPLRRRAADDGWTCHRRGQAAAGSPRGGPAATLPRRAVRRGPARACRALRPLSVPPAAAEKRRFSQGRKKARAPIGLWVFRSRSARPVGRAAPEAISAREVRMAAPLFGCRLHRLWRGATSTRWPRRRATA